MSSKKAIAVDFDGTVHAYTSGWLGYDVIPDPPIDGALGFLCRAVEVYDVTIFSRRALTDIGRRAMHAWFVAHGLPDDVLAQLTITCVKPKAGIYIDDRAWRFVGVFPTIEEIEAFKPWKVGDGQAE